MIALIEKTALNELHKRVMEEYVPQTQIIPELFTFSAAQGATIIELV